MIALHLRCTLAGSTLLAVMALVVGCGQPPEPGSVPERRNVILATTTSIQDSGLLDVLVPLFEQESSYRVKTIAVGTGEALAMGKRGDADVLLAHAPEKEQAIVDAGFAVNRHLVMHNDFLIAGPEDDPAGIHGSDDGAGSIAKIAESGAPFASRGDSSGTHFRERLLWETAGIDPEGDWYISTGQGMGATLLVAAEKRAYVLADRATYLATAGTTGLVAHVEADPVFLNLYSVMEVNPEVFPKVNHAGATAFSEFIRGPEAQKIIRGFGVETYGRPLFIPDAGTTEPIPAS